jgi:hypothetical protein
MHNSVEASMLSAAQDVIEEFLGEVCGILLAGGQLNAAGQACLVFADEINNRMSKAAQEYHNTNN